METIATVMKELGYAPHIWRRPRQAFDKLASTEAQARKSNLTMAQYAMTLEEH